MLALFGVAAVIVSPFAVVTFLRIRRDRAARAAAAAEVDAAMPGPTPVSGGADPSTERRGEVAALVGRVDAEALGHAPGEWFDLVVPADATIDGRPADEQLVARLVIDHLRRSGVEVDPDGSDGAGTDASRSDGRLRCRRR
jgi:hypothetical protein